MFRTIIVNHTGTNNYPCYFKLEYSGKEISICIQQSKTLFHLLPAIYSSAIKGTLVFSRRTFSIEQNESSVDFETYKQGLSNYLPEFFQEEFLLASEPMGLLRVYFMANDLGPAQKLLKKMPASNETVMLKCFLRGLPNLDSDSKNYTVDPAILKLSRPNYLVASENTVDVKKCIQICASLDDQTRLIFVTEMLPRIPALNILYFFSKIKVTGQYERIFVAVKAAEIAERGGMPHTATMLIAAAASEIHTGQDTLLRNSLIEGLLSRIQSDEWKFLVIDEIKKIKKKETREYGVCWLNVDDRYFNKTSQITISAFNRLYTYKTVKKLEMGWATGEFRLINPGCMFIDGIVFDEAIFFPIFSDKKSITFNIFDIKVLYGSHSCLPLDLTKDNQVYFRYFILADGRKVEINKSYRIVKRELSIELVNCEYADGAYSYYFKGTANIQNKVVMCKNSGNIVYENEREFTVNLNKGVEYFVIMVEIRDGIFEEFGIF